MARTWRERFGIGSNKVPKESPDIKIVSNFVESIKDRLLQELVRGETEQERKANLDDRIKAVKAYSQAAMILLSENPGMNATQKVALSQAQEKIMEALSALMIEKHGVHPATVMRLEKEISAGPPDNIDENEWKSERLNEIQSLLNNPGNTSQDNLERLKTLGANLKNMVADTSDNSERKPPPPPPPRREGDRPPPPPPPPRREGDRPPPPPPPPPRREGDRPPPPEKKRLDMDEMLRRNQERLARRQGGVDATEVFSQKKVQATESPKLTEAQLMQQRMMKKRVATNKREEGKNDSGRENDPSMSNK